METSVHEIHENDLEQVMRWRMAPDITKWMNTDPVLTLEEQKKWLNKIKSNKQCRYWIVQLRGNSVGVINLTDLDYNLKQGIWGYYIGERWARSIKLALSLELSLYQFFFEQMKFDRLYNEVLSINKGVIELHKRCGNIIEKELPNYVYKNNKYYDVTRMQITREIWFREKASLTYEYIEFGE